MVTRSIHRVILNFFCRASCMQVFKANSAILNSLLTILCGPPTLAHPFKFAPARGPCSVVRKQATQPALLG